MTALSGSQAGSTIILYYDLTWDAGTNGVTWTSYTVSTSTSVTVSGLSSGSTYQFKYRAQNVHGWGPYSPIQSATALDVPDQMTSVTTSMSGTNVKIAWSEPFTGGTNVDITAYDILIKKKDGSFVHYLTTCDGT
jgi:hypothetical protein